MYFIYLKYIYYYTMSDSENEYSDYDHHDDPDDYENEAEQPQPLFTEQDLNEEQEDEDYQPEENDEEENDDDYQDENEEENNDENINNEEDDEEEMPPLEINFRIDVLENNHSILQEQHFIELADSFKLNEVNDKGIIIYKNLKRLVELKKKHQNIDHTWFTNTEKIISHNQINELSNYTIQLISDAIINMMGILHSQFFNHDDITKIDLISNIVQEWINNMEYRDNGYHLNLQNIKNMQALLYFVFVMISDIKYIPAIISCIFCPKDIFTEQYLTRNVNGNSLIFMSLYNSDIRKIIIDNIGKEEYTNLLNKKTFISTTSSSIKTEVYYIECCIYFGNIYHLIKDNHIDVTKVNIPDYNILSLLYKSISPLVQHIRDTFENSISVDFDNLSFDNLSPDVIDYFKQQRYNKINDISPINYLVDGFKMVNQSYFTNNNNKIIKFIKPIYDISIIDNIAFNKKYPFEILFTIINYNQDDFMNISNETLQKYFTYAIIVMSEFLNINEIKNIYTILQKVAEQKNIKSYLKYYGCETSEIDMINLINDKNYKNTIKIMLYHNDKFNKFYFYELHKNLDDNEFIDLVKEFKFTIMKSSSKNLKVYEYFLSECINKYYDYDIFNEIYKNYIIANYTYDFNSSLIDYISPIFDIQNYSHKNIFAEFIISMLDLHNYTPINSILNKFVGIYFDEISKKINHNQFINFMKHFESYQSTFIKNNNITPEIKFGSFDDNYEFIINTLTCFNTIIDYKPDNISLYISENCIRIIDCLTHITNDNNMKNLINIFSINDEFIETYNIKTLYIDKLTDNLLDTNNFKVFLNNFPKIFKESDIPNIDLLKNVKHENCTYLLRNLIKNNFISIKTLENILKSSDFIGFDFIELSERQLLYINLIENYKASNIIVEYALNKYFKKGLEINQIESLNEIIKLSDYVDKLKITLNKTKFNLIKFYKNNDINICSDLILKYESTMTKDTICFSDKLEILIATSDILMKKMSHVLLKRIPLKIINKKVNSEENTVFNTETLYNIVRVCELYNISIPDILIKTHPEIIHTLNYLTENHIEQIKDYIQDYDNFIKLINFPKKSKLVYDVLKNICKNTDITMYIELIIFYNVDLCDEDIKLIKENMKTDINIIKYVLNNESLVKVLYNNDYHQICMIKNNFDNYALSICDNKTILKFINYYKLEDFEKTNKFNSSCLFALLNSKEIVEHVINKFGLSKLIKYKDNYGFNIYNKMIAYDLTDDIPKSYVLSNLINIVKKSNKLYIEKIFVIDNEYLNKMLEVVDSDGNPISYYLAVYHTKLFKYLITTKVITANYMHNNYNSETFLMKLIKDSIQFELEPLIKWIINNCNLEVSDYFVDYNNGSVLTYCLKYNKNLTKLFLKQDIVKNCINVYDTFNMICPYSDLAKSGVLKMNLVQIATIVDHDVLNQIIKNNKKYVSIFMKEKLESSGFEHNLLHIALFNNPESVQILLSSNMFNNDYLKDTEEKMDGFEKVIDIQPASWYYLLNGLKDKYDLQLNITDHWYGYNYKNKLTSDKIKHLTHYILDKQQLPISQNVCTICETYARKVVFTKCSHKVCITCAVHSDKCGICRAKVIESEKILM